MWANSVWSLLGFSVTFGLAMLLLSPEQMWLRPYLCWLAALCALASLVVLLWPLRHADNRTKALEVLKHPAIFIPQLLDARRMVLLGLVITILGVAVIAAGLWRQTEITPKSTAVAPTPERPPQKIVPPLARYTAYEKEQRLRAVDEIYSAVATQLQSIYNDGNSLLDGIYRGQIDSGAEERLTDYRSRVQAAFNNLNSILKKYSYFPDIVQVTRKNTFNDVEATHGVGNLVTEIQQFRQIAPNHIQWYLLRASTMELSRNQMRRFDQYLSDATKGLQEKRAEIEASQVYAVDNK
jgi:hypothetical protein